MLYTSVDLFIYIEAKIFQSLSRSPNTWWDDWIHMNKTRAEGIFIIFDPWYSTPCWEDSYCNCWQVLEVLRSSRHNLRTQDRGWHLTNTDQLKGQGREEGQRSTSCFNRTSLAHHESLTPPTEEIVSKATLKKLLGGGVERKLHALPWGLTWQTEYDQKKKCITLDEGIAANG